MTKKLVIVESPVKVKSISKFLGSEYKVEASMGHVRDLPEKKFGVDIEDNFKPSYVVPQKSKKLVTVLKKIAKDVKAIYLAPDPDREGEAIAWHLKELLAKDEESKVWRVTFNEITKEAILNAFKRPGRIDENKVSSQQARRILDRIVGYKISPLLWRKVKSGLSAGRVQSVALRLICEREEEIERFKPEEYWSIEADFYPKDRPKDIVSAKLEKYDGKKISINTAAEAEKVVTILKGVDTYKIDEINTKEKQRKPLPPFTTSLMQQASINRLGFTAHKTMFIAQQLYEGIELGPEGTVGLITYMRTDSYRIAKEAHTAAQHYIKEVFGDEYLPPKPPIYKSKKRTQEAHEAIRPTYLEKTPELVKDYLTPDQLKLYTLIWNRFLASQMVNARLEVTSVRICGGKAIFKVNGSRILFPGFLAVYKDEEENGEEKHSLLHLTEGELMLILDLQPKQHFTKPPPPYTEASLVKILEEKGIGRPSTYAPIIYTIVRRYYVNKEKSRLHPTELGKVVNGILVERFSDIIEVEFTAKMENELDEVERGRLPWTKVLEDFYPPFIKDLEIAEKEVKKTKIKPIETDSNCPKCGKKLVIRDGRYGRFLACSGFPKCRHTEPIVTDVACPEKNCDGMLIKRRSSKGRTFYGCKNYPKCTFTTNSLKKLQLEEDNSNHTEAVDTGERKETVDEENASAEKNNDSEKENVDIGHKEKGEAGGSGV